VPRPENAVLYKKYQALAAQTPHTHFVGRLATYRYYNMDQVVGAALTLYAELSGLKKRTDDGTGSTVARASRVRYTNGHSTVLATVN
jgi:UDP-galactopyranose mutase